MIRAASLFLLTATAALRADSQTVLYRVQLGAPISTFIADVGAIRSLAGGPRNAQLALMLEF